jgi:hypothetical protein
VICTAPPVNRLRHLLDADAPAGPPTETPPAVAAEPPDPTESAAARAEAFDVALAAAVHVLHGLLDSPNAQERLTAATAIINLKKASLRHRRPVFDPPEEPPFLPPLSRPGEAVADTDEFENRDDDEPGTGVGSPDPTTTRDRSSPLRKPEPFGRAAWHGRETVPQQETSPGSPERRSVPCTAGVVGLTAAEFRQGVKEVGLDRWEAICARIAGRFTWDQIQRLATGAKQSRKRRTPRPARRKTWIEPEDHDESTPPEPKPKAEAAWPEEDIQAYKAVLEKQNAAWVERADRYQAINVLSLR